MLTHYLKTAWRNIFRNRVNSTINIAGLAIGLAAVILIALFVRDELSYDRWFSHAGRIGQVDMDIRMGGQSAMITNTPPTVGAAIQQAFPQVEAVTRYYVMSNEVVSNDANSRTRNHFTEKNLLAVDSNFLQVFDYPVLEGDPKSCLMQPHSIVLTQTAAKKYFGSGEAIGRLLVLDEYQQPFTVTAVLKDVPDQSTVTFDLLIPTSACPPVKRFGWSWVWLQMQTYVLFKPDVTPDDATFRQIESGFPAMVRIQAATAFKRIGQPYDQFLKAGNRWNFFLQRFTDVHLRSANLGSQFIYNLGDIKQVYILASIALFIIILACVNFMNLATAQSATRAKEIGVRKVLGSERSQLIRQFLAEAMLFSVIAAGIALCLVAASLPLFNNVAGKTLAFGSIFHSWIGAFVIGLTVITGLLAGSYPAFYLTSFDPVSVLKGGLFRKSLSNAMVRNGLVVFQFTVSIALISCTVILFQQLRFTQNKDLGLKKDNILILPNAEKMDAVAEETLRQQLATLPGVVHASIATSVPTARSFGDNYVPEVSKGSSGKDIMINSFIVDDQYVPALQLQILQGRNFSRDFSDSDAVILNETAVRQIGWTSPIGRLLTYTGHNNQQFRVIGVVRDFDVESIRNTIVPFALFYTSSKSYYAGQSNLVLKLGNTPMQPLLAAVESKWKEFAPDVPFEYEFLDKSFESMYSNEQRLGKVFGIFTILSISVACLGLFALSVYTAERRKKEIGIRKVLGASVQGVVSLLSREFVKLVVIAAIIACPVAWYFMERFWLQDFVYRIKVEWWMFVSAAALSLVIAMITISFQSIRAALASPAKSLRSE